MKYDYHESSHRKKKFLKRIYIAVMVVLLLVILAGAVIKVDSLLNKEKNTPDATTSSITTSYFAPSTQIFRTKYFQFQTNKNWSESPADSSDHKFVYRSMRNNLIEHELDVYVQQIPANLSATMLMPITTTNGNQEIVPGTVSKHCREKAGAMTAADKIVNFSGIDMLCDVDNTQYKVIVGKKGEGTKITLTRPNKEKLQYTIYYMNVTAKPEAQQLVEILNSFQTR